MFSHLAIVAAVVVTLNGEAIGQRSYPMFPSGRIVGGESTTIEKHPHQISLERLGRHTCGGSIISSRYVVTAGHCVSAGASQLRVRAGSGVVGKAGSLHQVERIIRHPNYTTNAQGVPINDVALLLLNASVPFDRTRQPIGLFNASEESKPGVQSVISGWGSTGHGMPSQLQSVVIPIVSKQLCDSAYRPFGGLPPGQICAAFYGEGGKDSCQGDSGGPLTIQGRLAGIVSWGSGCATPYYPGVYTEVAAFRRWIDDNAKL